MNPSNLTVFFAAAKTAADIESLYEIQFILLVIGLAVGVVWIALPLFVWAQLSELRKITSELRFISSLLVRFKPANPTPTPPTPKETTPHAPAPMIEVACPTCGHRLQAQSGQLCRCERCGQELHAHQQDPG